MAAKATGEFSFLRSFSVRTIWFACDPRNATDTAMAV